MIKHESAVRSFIGRGGAVWFVRCFDDVPVSTAVVRLLFVLWCEERVFSVSLCISVTRVILFVQCAVRRTNRLAGSTAAVML